MLHRSVLNLLLKISPATRWFGFGRYICKWFGIELGSNTALCGGVQFYGNGSIRIGSDCWIGIGCKFYLSENASITIGDCVDVAPEVVFHTGSHAIGDAARRAGIGRSGDISIQSGCWIGVRSVVLLDVIVENGCIIAAGSTLLSGRYPSNSFIAGLPGTVRRELS